VICPSASGVEDRTRAAAHLDPDGTCEQIMAVVVTKDDSVGQVES
jgi:hypothetical protein